MKKAQSLTFGDLPRIARDPARPNQEPRRPFLFCPICRESFSANPSDYWDRVSTAVVTCEHCDGPLVLADRLSVVIPWGKRAECFAAVITATDAKNTFETR